MKFSTSILVATTGIVAPLGSSAFSTVFSRGVTRFTASKSVSANRKSCSCGQCAACASTHARFCSCPACSGLTAGRGLALRMSDAADAEAEAVPSEVVAMDGVASEEEAHNVDRPARASGIHKHKEGDKARVELKDLEIGAEILAKVKTVTSYGAFLDIGAVSDALVHVSRLSDDFVANVGDIVKQGEEVTVRVLSVDLDKKQIAVTMRSPEAEAKAADGPRGQSAGRRRDRPQRSGGDQAAQAATIAALDAKGFDDGQFVDGEVVSALDFGAFVRFDTSPLGEGLEGEVDGLVHISALADGRTNAVSDVVTVGDKVRVRIRTVDTDAGRISLSMITKEQEEARPQPQKRGGGGNNFDPVGSSWKNTGAADWKEQLEEFGKDQTGFTNTAVIQDRRKVAA